MLALTSAFELGSMWELRMALRTGIQWAILAMGKDVLKAKNIS